MPEELRTQPGMHTGYTSLANVMEYGPFRQLYPGWKLPPICLVKKDEKLLKVHHALTQVPNHDKVAKELENGLLHTPPSYEALFTPFTITLVTQREACRDSPMQ